MAAIELGVKFSLEKLDQVVNGFNKLIEGVDFGKGFELDAVAVRSQFDIIKQQLQEALKSGELNVNDLKLPALARALELLGKKAAKALGSELNDQALAPFKNELDALSSDINKKGDEIKALTEQRKSLTPKAVREAAKSETGFTGKVMHGGEEEAFVFLKKLKEEEGKDPGGNERRTQLINFYSTYVAKLREAEKLRGDLNIKESALKTGITLAKAKEEELLLKIKKESAKLDSQAPQKYKEILALTQELREVQSHLRKSQKAANDEKKKEIELTDESAKANRNEGQSFASKAISAGLYYTAINAVKRLMRESISVVQELDKAMTEAAIVTDMNRQEAWALMGTYQDLARETGVAVAEISGVVVEFLRQGRSMKEALELAEVAAKSAKVAAISSGEAVKFLTSAVNGFGLAADQAVDIADKFAAVASQSASSFSELATAMSKVAPVAKSAGVGVDFMMGVLAKGLETTREAPENIGTAFKTIFARMREVTDIGKATEDGMSLNRVEKALASINVPLRDVTGQFRNLEDVLVDVGNDWNNLTSIEQAYLATALAGTRQQPRLLAIFNDFARTKELIEISSEAVGALEFQHVDYMDGMEAAMNKLQNSWQGFIMALTDSDLVVTIIEGLTFVIDKLAGALKFLNTPAGHTITILGLVGVALTTMLAKVLINTAATIKQALATAVLNLVNKKADKTYRGLNTMKLNTMITTYGLTVATGKETAAAKAATWANANLGKAFLMLGAQIWAALLPLLPFIAAALAVVAIGALIFVSLAEASKGAEFFGDAIAKINKRMNDLDNKEEKVKKLSDRFKELQRITNKTADNIKEMADIASELEEVTITTGANQKEQTFNFAKVDFTGESVFDEAEYQKFLDAVEAERERLNKIAASDFASGVAKEGAKAFEDKNIADFARKQGYEAGVAFADNLGKGFSDETKAKVKKQLADSLKKMDMTMFYTMRYRTSDGKEFDTAKERDDYVSSQRSAGNKITALTNYDQMGFDEGALEEFSEKLVKIYADGTEELQDEIDKIMEEGGPNQAKKILQATVREYQEQIEDARAQFEGEELKAAIAFIAQSNEDAAIFSSLMDKEIDIDLILNLQAQGLDAGAIEEFVSQYMFDEETAFAGQTSGAGFRSAEERDAFVQGEKAKSDAILEAAKLATSGGADNITAGFIAFEDALRAAGYTEEEIEEQVKELGKVVQTLSVEQVGALIKSQAQMTKNAMDLSAQISKGDFSNFGEIVAEYGIEAATNILNGSEAGIRAVMEKNREKTMGEIGSSIAEIYRLERVDTFDQLSKAAQEQVRALELTRDYYDDIVGFEMLREFRMKQVTGYMKEMNDLLKLQQSLLNLGMSDDDGFLGTINGMVDSLDRLARAKIDKQLEADLANLEKFGTFDGEGNFIVNPDINIEQAEQAIDAAMSTLTTYVQMQTEAFNRQKKAIEDASKAEIDAAKTAFDERWKAVEYTDKLREAEEKIFEVRRRVAALAISGAGGGQFAETQKELQKLEQERRKMIEQQGLQEVQKELEAQRDEAIASAQQEMTLAIQQYTNELTEVLPQLTEKLEELIVALDDNTVSTEDNTEETVTISRGKEKLGDRTPFLPML